jgi:integrase
MKALTRQELESLLSKTACSQERLMYSVIVNHGLRISEALRMDKTNIKAGTLIVQRLKGSLKTEQPLLPNEKADLEYLAKTVEGPFFKTCDRTVEEHCEDLCGCRRKANRHFKQACEAAGISPLKASCHKLKHTTAMLGLKGGMAINELQTYLGHVNGQNTLEYLKVNDEEASKAFAAAIGGSI